MDQVEIDKLRQSAAERIVARLNQKILAAAGAGAAAGLATQELNAAVIEEEARHPGLKLDLASVIVYRPAQFIDARDLRVRNSAWQLLGALIASYRLFRGGELRPDEIQATIFQVKAALRNAGDVEFMF